MTAIYVRIPTEWDRVEQVRTFVHSYILARADDELADRVAVTVHELLENAVKYGAVTREIELDVRLPRTGPDFEVRVSNAVVAARLELLGEELARLNSMDPQEAYIDSIQRSKTRLLGSCGIGLSRIRCEADVKLTLLTEDADWVTIVATSIR